MFLWSGGRGLALGVKVRRCGSGFRLGLDKKVEKGGGRS